MRSVMAVNYSKIAAGAALELFKSYRPDYPDGGQMRDFVWVADCVDVVLWMLNHPFPSSIYNVGSGSARTWTDLGRAMFRALGKSERIEFIEMPPSLRTPYQYFTEAPIDKLREAGYLQEMTLLDEGVRLYVENYLCRDDPFA
jgi:ADP-L-glycero-D-manno-heptose 6-epimerase